MDATPSLFRLPRELRDEVYTYLANELVEPPANPSASGNRISEGTLRFQDSLNQCQWSIHAISRTSRQLRAEVRDYTSRLRKLRCGYSAELDIMFEDFASWPTWIYFPLDAARGKPFDLTVHIRIFSAETFTRYDQIANTDGWNLGDMSAPFLDFLLLLKRFVRYGPSFGLREPCLRSGIHASSNLSHAAGLFKLNNLVVSATYHNGTSNTGNNSNLIKCCRELARNGLARGVTNQIEFKWNFYNYRGELREGSKYFTVEHELDEERMQRCVRRGLCHATSESLADGPLQNGEAVKIGIEDWCCG